jgi:serine/threonine protein kinase
VYSLAAIVFRTLSGKVPFEGSMIDLLRKVTTGERPRLTPLRPDLSPEIDGWVERALAIKPEDRFPYVSTMWNELIRILMDGPTPSARKVRATFRLPDPQE